MTSGEELASVTPLDAPQYTSPEVSLLVYPMPFFYALCLVVIFTHECCFESEQPVQRRALSHLVRALQNTSTLALPVPLGTTSLGRGGLHSNGNR